MAFTSDDVLACPPPLFHCFGLVLGLMACITHGSKIVLPGEVFDAEATLRAVSDEQCTALHGVPAMFDSILSLPRPAGFDCTKLRTGIIAGAPVPRHLMEGILVELGMTEYTSSYGEWKTETPNHKASNRRSVFIYDALIWTHSPLFFLRNSRSLRGCGVESVTGLTVTPN